MTLANIAIYIALIVFIVFKRMAGRPVGPPKKQFILPVVLIVIGWGDATKGLTKPIDVTFTIVGCAVSLVLGMARGRADRISTRDGAAYVQWTWLSVGLFAANLVIKLVLDLAGVAAGETAKAAGSSLLVSLALTLLGEAAVIWYRSGGASQLNSGWPADQRRLDTEPPRPFTPGSPAYQDPASGRPAGPYPGSSAGPYRPEDGTGPDGRWR